MKKPKAVVIPKRKTSAPRPSLRRVKAFQGTSYGKKKG